MNSIFSKIRDKHALWYKGIVFIMSVMACTYLLPVKQNETFKQLQVGDIWKKENLIADIDFLIQKSNAEINLNNDSLSKKIFYFTKEQISNIDVLNNASIDDKIKKEVHVKLDSIYNIGYYSSNNNVSEADSIFIVNNNEAKKITLQQLINKSELISILKPVFNNDTSSITILNNLPINVIFNANLSTELSTSLVHQNNIYKNKISKGTTLLKKNEVVTNDQYNVLLNYKRELDAEADKSYSTLILIGKIMACTLILGIMILFLAFFRKNIFSLNTHYTFILSIIVLMVLASNIVSQYNQNFIFAVPFCLVPVIIRVFFDSRTALFNFLNIVLLCAFFATDKFEFIFIQLIAGIGTIFSVADISKRSKLLVSTLLSFTFYILAFVAYHLINQSLENITHISNYYPFIISSMFIVFAFPLIFLFEKLFGFMSDFTLLELCDLNNPLLRELSQKIPGTFQHSLQVANLAEEACYKIGGNALLVRTGAMYHDIGKINNARFFTENQVGEVSPHEDLTSEESAKIIINHVISGIEIAKENNLPEAIIDFIRTHHGTTTTRFFLSNYKKEHVGQMINEDLFRYPGPIPFSKETAVLMMADSVEASSRSLKKYDAVTIDELVDRIINHQITENQFINSDITFRDINQIKKIFKKRLMNIYHVRIEYPR